MLDKETQKLFEELGVEEFEEADEQIQGKFKVVFRSRWWWYNWFSRAIRRTTNFWGSEASTYGIKSHKVSYNVRISSAISKVFGKYNQPAEHPVRYGQKLGANQRVNKINRYNKYYVNKKLSVFNPKQ